MRNLQTAQPAAERDEVGDLLVLQASMRRFHIGLRADELRLDVGPLLARGLLQDAPAVLGHVVADAEAFRELQQHAADGLDARAVSPPRRRGSHPRSLAPASSASRARSCGGSRADRARLYRKGSARSASSSLKMKSIDGAVNSLTPSSSRICSIVDSAGVRGFCAGRADGPGEEKEGARHRRANGIAWPVTFPANSAAIAAPISRFYRQGDADGA